MSMLLSYEYKTKKIRFHFNMKEPGAEKLSEYDFQWNTYLDLTDPIDMAMVNEKK